MKFEKNLKMNYNGGEEVPPGGWRGGEETQLK